MPFLAPLIPAIVSAGVGVAGNALVNSLTGDKSNPNLKSATVQDPFSSPQQMQAGQAVQSGIAQQQMLANALAGQGGLQNQSDVYGALQGVASGQGPNPAQSMLNQATGQNIANQSALMAGQRGASINPGLIARQAALQGGNIQQQAVGQGSTLQAQQALNALSQMGGIANQQVTNQIGGVQGLNAAAQGNQGQILGAIQGVNAANVGNTEQLNKSQTALAVPAMGMQGSALGGLLQGVGSAVAQGAQALTPATPTPRPAGVSGPLKANGGFAHGGMIPPHLRPIAEMFHGQALASGKFAMKQGGMVPGKAAIAGDSAKNDTVKTMLSPGEAVLPRSVMESKDPAQAAAQFVTALLKKNGSANHEKDFKEALGRAVKNRKST